MQQEHHNELLGRDETYILMVWTMHEVTPEPETLGTDHGHWSNDWFLPHDI
jgi:hypothetical protein